MPSCVCPWTPGTRSCDFSVKSLMMAASSIGKTADHGRDLRRQRPRDVVDDVELALLERPINQRCCEGLDLRATLVEGLRTEPRKDGALHLRVLWRIHRMEHHRHIPTASHDVPRHGSVDGGEVPRVEVCIPNILEARDRPAVARFDEVDGRFVPKRLVECERVLEGFVRVGVVVDGHGRSLVDSEPHATGRRAQRYRTGDSRSLD